MAECSFMNYVVVGSDPVPVTYILDVVHFTNKEIIELQVAFCNKFHWIQVCDMAKKHYEGLHFSSIIHSGSNALRNSYHSAEELLTYKFLFQINLFTLQIKASCKQ